MHDIESYVRPNGRCPYEKYKGQISRSGEKGIAEKIAVAIKKLSELGSAKLVGINLAEKMNDVWQLRPGKHRIFYFWDGLNSKYILLNGYRKATRNTPPEELGMAESLRNEYLSRR